MGICCGSSQTILNPGPIPKTISSYSADLANTLIK